jgi:hypothetical protein
MKRKTLFFSQEAFFSMKGVLVAELSENRMKYAEKKHENSTRKIQKIRDCFQTKKKKLLDCLR